MPSTIMDEFTIQKNDFVRILQNYRVQLNPLRPFFKDKSFTLLNNMYSTSEQLNLLNSINALQNDIHKQGEYYFDELWSDGTMFSGEQKIHIEKLRDNVFSITMEFRKLEDLLNLSFTRQNRHKLINKFVTFLGNQKREMIAIYVLITILSIDYFIFTQRNNIILLYDRIYHIRLMVLSSIILLVLSYFSLSKIDKLQQLLFARVSEGRTTKTDELLEKEQILGIPSRIVVVLFLLKLVFLILQTNLISNNLVNQILFSIIFILVVYGLISVYMTIRNLVELFFLPRWKHIERANFTQKSQYVSFTIVYLFFRPYVFLLILLIPMMYVSYRIWGYWGRIAPILYSATIFLSLILILSWLLFTFHGIVISWTEIEQEFTNIIQPVMISVPGLSVSSVQSISELHELNIPIERILAKRELINAYFLYSLILAGFIFLINTMFIELTTFVGLFSLVLLVLLLVPRSLLLNLMGDKCIELLDSNLVEIKDDQDALLFIKFHQYVEIKTNSGDAIIKWLLILVSIIASFSQDAMFATFPLS